MALVEEYRQLMLRKALEDLLELYVQLANSGDAGFWNCEEEEEVINARRVLEGVN